MKITKKKPLRPRGRTDEKRQSAKDAIRDAYANGPQREVQIIPAKRDLETGQPQKKLRVCAYCRVSTDEDTQASSYELQVQNYTKMIQENPEYALRLRTLVTAYTGMLTCPFRTPGMSCWAVDF